ncbi:MAG: hypothetical protein NTU53_22630 [Planctomycetota bacterium]|nr:hypothetical protein [Planctomycetota bacterium]
MQPDLPERGSVEPVKDATPQREASQPEFRIWKVLLGVVVGLALLIALVSVLSRIRKESVVRVDMPSESPRERGLALANQVKCASNLRQIGQGIMLYANDRGGKFPPRLEVLITDVDLNPEVFVCPASNDKRATGPTTQAMLAELGKKGHCSYVYLGAGMTTSVPPDTVVAYEILDHHEKARINVLFGDGHVEWVVKAEAERIIKDLQAGRNPPNPKP